jgi:hypothetical protein
MSKILFIRTKSIPHIKEGRELLMDRNFTIFQKIFGKENIEKVDISNNISKKKSNKKIKQFFLILKGYADGLHPKVIMSICENANNFNTIFIDCSISGIIEKKLRESAYKGKIITHFHNVKSMFFKTDFSPYSIHKPFYIHRVLQNNMCGLRYSDISTLIHNADVLIMPIFDSSRMKVKTCSALMYGKNILGTDEAFENSNLDFEKICGKRNTKNMFIEAIKNCSEYKQLKYNEYFQNLYKNNYIDSAAEYLFDKIITHNIRYTAVCLYNNFNNLKIWQNSAKFKHFRQSLKQEWCQFFITKTSKRQKML